MQVKTTINGASYQDEVEPRLLLVHYIRQKAHLTGTHIGCDTGNCGACTILFAGKPLKSCMLLAVQANGAEITTIEGLGKGKGKEGLHPLQAAFVEKFGFQCGYCTPGMIMNASALLESNASPSKAEIREAIEGNICMCTGYQQIVESIDEAARQMKE